MFRWLTSVVGAGLLLVAGSGAGVARAAQACGPLVVKQAVAEPFFNFNLRVYANDNSSTKDWTGGDTTFSARLPNGDVVWSGGDTFLGTVNMDGSRSIGTGDWVRSSAVLMRPDNQYYRTIAGPAWLPEDPADPDTWAWQAAGFAVDTESGTQVLRQLVIKMRFDRPAEHPFGYVGEMAVATYSLPALTRLTIKTVYRYITQPIPERLVFGSVHAEGGHFYLYGNDFGSPTKAYAARVPAGELDEAASWRYWNGGSWAAGIGAAAPMTTQGVHIGYSVVKQDDTYVMFTLVPSRSIVKFHSYWGCSPTGPWNGPDEAYDPTTDGRVRAGYYYNPHVHPEFGNDPTYGWIVTYDVNDSFDRLFQDVELYRPRFSRMKLAAP